MLDINTACLTDLVQDDITLVACPAPSHKTTLVQHSLLLLEHHLLLFSKVFHTNRPVIWIF